MKKHLSNLILALIFLTGLSLLLYPTVSDYWNSFHQSKAITEYADLVSDLDEDEYEEIWTSAQAYNEELARDPNRYHHDEEEHRAYESQLNINGYGIMGYLEIPSIDCSLTIYHGTDEAVLQIAVGHIEGTSLPVGGQGTHCALSGHRGLPSAKLLTHLDKMVVGDLFMIRTLDECLTYEVDQILIVEPDDIGALEIEEDKDYCTLVTCTPYGVNSHRLLVRGVRTENQPITEAIRVVSDAILVDPMIVFPFLTVPILILVVAVMLFGGRKKKR